MRTQKLFTYSITKILILVLGVSIFLSVPPQLAWAKKKGPSSSASSQSSETNNVVVGPHWDVVATEHDVEEAAFTVASENKPIEIRTRSGHVYFFDHIVTNESESEKSRVGESNNNNPDDDVSRSFRELEDMARLRFQENRIFFLTHAATLLDRADLMVGFGSLIKGKLKRVRKKFWPKKNPIEELAKETLPDSEETPPTIRQRGHEVVQALLHSFDRQLWVSAPLVANQNEFNVTIGISPQIEGGARDKGTGGSIGLGINLGFNRDNKSLVFEITDKIDSFKNAFTPFFTIGISPTIGFGMRVNRPGHEMDTRRGTTLYPPAAPGYYTRSATMLSIGLSSALFSFPPSPIGDAFWYVNNTTKHPLFRIELSAVTGRFVRVFLPKFKSQASDTESEPKTEEEKLMKRSKTVVDMINIVNGWVKRSYNACASLLKKKTPSDEVVD